MFAFPLSKMVGGIVYEHGHRLITSVVGLLTIGLAVWIARLEPRAWVRRLGWVALAAVVMQGLLGGVTVLYAVVYVQILIGGTLRHTGAGPGSLLAERAI